MEIKKNPKYDLRRSSIIFFQIGMILMLFFTWRAMEWTTVDAPESDVSMAEVAEDLEEVVPRRQTNGLVERPLLGHSDEPDDVALAGGEVVTGRLPLGGVDAW